MRSDASDLQMIDSTTAKAHRSAGGGKGGALAQAIGRSRGGRTTKIHAVVDCLGRLIAFEITPGQLGDVRVAEALLAPTPTARLCIADTAYDSDALRRFLSERGTQPVIPNNPTRKRFHPFDTAARGAEFGGVVAGQDRHLLHRIGRKSQSAGIALYFRNYRTHSVDLNLF